MPRIELADGIATIQGVLTPAECEVLVARIEATGFEMASISTDRGAVIDANVRNNDRVILDDCALAADIWARIAAVIPQSHKGMRVCGLNERFRFYRYMPGQSFKWHTDGSVRLGNGEISQFTFMIYLNEGYSGGETVFQAVRVAGKIGMALMFEHAIMHEGSAVTGGAKYVLRTDIMYAPVNLN